MFSGKLFHNVVGDGKKKRKDCSVQFNVALRPEKPQGLLGTGKMIACTFQFYVFVPVVGVVAVVDGMD